MRELDLDQPTESMVESTLPTFPGDSRKGRYLSYRLCGFAIRESIKLAKITQRSVMRWRAEDPEFKRLDTEMLPEVRKRLGEQYLDLEFRRNYRLVLEKDFTVISKSVQSPNSLTQQEHGYLLKLRAHYTPQQLQILQQLLKGEGPKEFHWTDLTMLIASLKRTTEADGVKETQEIQLRR